MRARSLLLLVVLASGVIALACDRAAELIPGDEAPSPALDDPGATPTPVIAPPILPPDSVRVAGNGSGGNGPAEVITDAELARSVVQLELFDSSTGFVQLVRSGSGVVVDASRRLILTSYVLVEPFRDDGGPAYTTIAVAVNRAAGGQPSLEFEAEIVEADPARDLAVLRLARLYRGGEIGPADFDLPAVTPGDADALEPGDALRLLGHPGLDPGGERGSQAVVATTATVTGFRGDAGIEGRAWLKTDARLPWGIAGGPVFDAAGALVGVATQLAYDPAAVVGQVLPVTLATELIERARRAGPEARYGAPLQRPPFPLQPQPLAPADGVVVSAPAFAQNALEGAGGLDLFDYTLRFPTPPTTLYYEYAGQRIADGALVEERWYLDDVLQDALSSSYRWLFGAFSVVGDRLASAGPNGLPPGRWRLEVWVDGALRSFRAAYVAVDPPAEPGVGAIAFGSLASVEQAVLAGPSGQAQQLLAFFDYEQAGGATRLRWIVFRDGSVVFQSPIVSWEGGDSGRWWVGYATSGPIGAGFWEFEIYLDSPLETQPVSRGADGVQLF